jgi:hypothetical protein
VRRTPLNEAAENETMTDAESAPGRERSESVSDVVNVAAVQSAAARNDTEGFRRRPDGVAQPPPSAVRAVTPVV